MYLFDTDVLSHLAKQRRSERLMERLAETPQAAQFTSAVNTAEIYYGLRRMEGREGTRTRTIGRDGEGAQTNRAEILRGFFEEQVFPQLTILPFDEECAPIYGRIKAALERKGQPRYEPDLQIAAIALRHGLTVVTGNVRHFYGVPGLTVENWF